SSTNQGALRKNWTTAHDRPRIGRCSEIRAKPSSTPASVPASIAKKLISRLNRNPLASNGVHLTSNSMTDGLPESACTCATTTEVKNTTSSATPTRDVNNASLLD